MPPRAVKTLAGEHIERVIALQRRAAGRRAASRSSLRGHGSAHLTTMLSSTESVTSGRGKTLETMRGLKNRWAG